MRNRRTSSPGLETNGPPGQATKTRAGGKGISGGVHHHGCGYGFWWSAGSCLPPLPPKRGEREKDGHPADYQKQLLHPTTTGAAPDEWVVGVIWRVRARRARLLPSPRLRLGRSLALPAHEELEWGFAALVVRVYESKIVRLYEG